MIDDINNIEAGTIQSLKLKNFMCHQNLIVNFHHGLNVITGSNGSGKSAILTAIIFVLGGKAASTNRASKYHELVKKDAATASVVIKLYNSGDDAYKSAEYGDIIVIERNISREGTTKFYIRKENGSLVSNKREDVTAITDHFNIQIDNPINILTQENTKSFLNSNDPKVKYKLFMSATNLNQVLLDYDDCEKAQKEIEEKLIYKKDSMEKQQFYLEELQSKIQMASEIEKIDSKLEAVRHKLTCREIKDLDSMKEKYVQNKNKDESVLNNFVEKDKQIMENIAEEEEMYQNLNSKIQVLEKEIDEISTEKRRCQEQLSKGSENIQRKNVSINNTRSELKNSQAAYESLNKKFKEMIKTGNDNQKTQQTALQDNIQRLTNENESMEEQMKNLKNQTRELEEDLRRNRTLKETLSRTKNSTNIELTEKNRKISSLKQNSHERLNVFGSFTGELAKKIADAHHRGVFARAPVGPIGYLIQVVDQKWCLSVELCLKSFLRAYLVFNYKDKQTLQSFLSKLCRPEEYPTIIIASYTDMVYDYQKNRPHCNYPAMVDILKCTDHNIINTLIDHCGIEKIACISDVKDARSVMIPNPPQNAQKAFTAEGDEIIVARGNSRFYSCANRDVKFLGKDLSTIIENLEKECKQSSEKLVELDTQISEVNLTLKKIEENIVSLRSKEATLRSKINQNRSEILQLESKLEALNERTTSTIEQELISIQEKNKGLEEQLNRLNMELKETQLSNKDIQKQYEGIKSQTVAVKTNWNELKQLSDEKLQNINYLKTSRSTHVKNVEKAKQKVTSADAAINKLETSISTLKCKLDENNQAFVDVEEDRDSLNLEIQKLRKAVDTQKMSIDDLKKLKTECDALSNSYQQSYEHISNITTMNINLKNMLAERHKTFNKLRTMIVRRSTGNFEELLQKRGYQGSLAFDHVNTSLNIQVHTSDAEQKSSDTKGLSGGERSFSTLSFVVSLWHCIDCPFRCLDEFDVFMDVIHRRAGLTLLREYSISESNHQLILITPQNIQDLASVEEGITVIQMDSPR